MQTYVILRRAAWQTSDEVAVAAERSGVIGDGEMRDDIRWIRTYVLEDHGGTFGSVCIYQATSPEAVREHARLVGMPADEIIAVADTVVLRPDPEPVKSEW